MCFDKEEPLLFTINELIPFLCMFLFSSKVLKLSLVAYWTRHVQDI